MARGSVGRGPSWEWDGRDGTRRQARRRTTTDKQSRFALLDSWNLSFQPMFKQCRYFHRLRPSTCSWVSNILRIIIVYYQYYTWQTSACSTMRLYWLIKHSTSERVYIIYQAPLPTLCSQTVIMISAKVSHNKRFCRDIAYNRNIAPRTTLSSVVSYFLTKRQACRSLPLFSVIEAFEQI